MRRVLAAALLAVGLGAAGAGCPARDLNVQITDDGIQTVVIACESFRDACRPGPNGLCNRNLLLCDPKTCTLRNRCELPASPEWAADKVMGLSLLLVEASTEGIKLRRKSACVPLNLRPCLRDVGCPGAPLEARDCVHARVDDALRDALGNGLTFDGFESPDDVLLTAAIYRKKVDDDACDRGTVEPADCAPENLVAVAGLAAPAGSSTFDVTCASCQYGTHGSLGRDNGACPVTDDDCFLVRIGKLLAESGE